MARPRRIGGADRVDPQLLAKFASEIRVSTHGLEASESGRRLSAILSPVDRDLYRRRQRRRAIIAWSVAGLVIAAIGLGIAFGSTESDQSTTVDSSIQLFSSAMTAEQFEAIHKGESESQVLLRLQSVGLQESQVESSQLPSLFPVRPQHSTCSYWTLSDAPGHLVRLCFSDPEGVLLQKAVAVSGGAQAPKTLA
jgi:hypothetical protein